MEEIMQVSTVNRRWLLHVAIILAMLVALMSFQTSNADPAYAWPAPEVTGDCDGWYVQEVAPDRDWVNTEYWTIDDVDGQFVRGDKIPVPDGSDATSREFTVRWFDNQDNQLDKRTGEGTRALSDCEEPPAEPVYDIEDKNVCEGVSWSWNGENLDEDLVLIITGPHGETFYPFTTSGQTDLFPHGTYGLDLWWFGEGEPFEVDALEELDGNYEVPEDCNEPEAPIVDPMFVGPNCDDPNSHITLKTGDGEGTRHVEVLANEESIFEGVMGPNETVVIDHEVTGPTEYLLVIDESKGGIIGNADVPTDCHVEMPSMSTDQVCFTETGLTDISATNDGNVDGMISLSGEGLTSFGVGETVEYKDVSPGTYTLTATFMDEAETEIVEVVLVECEMDETDLPPTSSTSTVSISTPAVLARKTSWLS